MKIRSPLIPIISILIILGLIFIAAASPMEANSTLNNQYFFIKKQLIWVLIGAISFLVGSHLKIKIIKSISLPLFIGSSVLLLFVLLPKFGNQALGAKRWLNFGFIDFQPSEVLKLSSVIFFPFLFSNEKKRNIKNLLLYLSFPLFLIIMEPNLSTAVLMVIIATSVYYLSGGKTLPLFTLYFFLTAITLILTVSSPYRFNRLKTLINQNDSSAANYHYRQIILGLASGGLFGKGFANSDQKYRFIPKLSTDSILAIIGEETGFFGLMAIMLIYLYLIVYLLRFSQTIHSQYESLLVAATACWIAYQSLINISAQTALIPLTGIPLPFISYGGSSLISLLFALGLVHNIEKNQYKLLYSNDVNTRKRRYYHYRRSSHSRYRTDKTA